MEELDKITYDLWDRQARAVLQHHYKGIQRRSHTIYENSEKTAESDGHCPGIKQDHILSAWEHGRVRTTLWTIKQISRIHTICRGTENVAESDRHNVQQMSNKKTRTLCGNGEKLSSEIHIVQGWNKITYVLWTMRTNHSQFNIVHQMKLLTACRNSESDEKLDQYPTRSIERDHIRSVENEPVNMMFWGYWRG